MDLVSADMDLVSTNMDLVSADMGLASADVDPVCCQYRYIEKTLFLAARMLGNFIL